MTTKGGTDSGSADAASREKMVKRLESGGRILALIRKAETKKVAKRKIITFLKKKGVSESKIIEAYSAYYGEEGLYEITFTQRPLGFSVIMDTRGMNAIVSSIQDENNEKLGMKVASRVYEVNGHRADDRKHKEILQMMASQPLPFYVVFKESKKKSNKLQKQKTKMEKGLKWQTEEQYHSDEDESEDSDTIESYDSDDDEAHVAQHNQRKKQTQKLKEKKEKKEKDSKDEKQDSASMTPSLFKPHEIDKWDDSQLEDEQAAMLKQLSRLMMGAVVSADEAANGVGGDIGGVINSGGDSSGGGSTVRPSSGSGSAPLDMSGMTHKRQNTLRTLLDAAASPADVMPDAKKNTLARKLSVSDLEQSTVEDEDYEYDPEIFKYLQELVGDRTQQQVPLTPSSSKLMKDLFFFGENVDDDDDVQINLPPFGVPVPNQNNDANDVNGNAAETPNSAADDQGDSKNDGDDEDVIESLENGTTLLKYGKYGKPKYKMFHLTSDHKYLEWYSQKKSSEQTRIPIAKIRKIAIGSDSKVIEKTKNENVHQTSFTIFYGKSSEENTWKSLTVSAKNAKEAYVWAQGLKILADASKRGRHVPSLSTKEIPSDYDLENEVQKLDDDENKANDNNNDNDNEEKKQDSQHKHRKTESVIISIDQLQKQSVLNLFSKSSRSTVASLLKQHAKHKRMLQKCVDFVMTKANYKAITKAAQFEKVKAKLEELDIRLRKVKDTLTVTTDLSQSELSNVKADLFSAAADLDALKQKLTAIVRRPQKL